MEQRDQDIAVEPGPLRLADLWRARRGFVYRFERRRLRARRGLARRVLVAALAVSLFGICTLVSATDPALLREMWLARHAVLALILCSACLSGLRAFATERASGTMDALAMTPLSRRELLLGHLWACVTPQLLCLFACFGITLHEILYEINAAPESGYFAGMTMTGGLALSSIAAAAGFWAYYAAAVLLVAALGLHMSLRLRSAAAAVAATLGAVSLGYASLSALFNAIATAMGRVYPAYWPARFSMEEAAAAIYGQCTALYVLVGSVFLACARFLLGRAARRFDDWALGKDA